VFALNAQFGVDAGGKRGSISYPCLRSQGAFQWHGNSDPVFVETCSCAGLLWDAFAYPALIPYESGVNLYCGA